MITRLRIVSIAAASMLVVGTQALAFQMGAPAYRTDYYNNSAHDVLVGSIFPNGCFYDDFTEVDTVSYKQVGPQTSYFDPPVLVGYCYQGQYDPH